MHLVDITMFYAAQGGGVSTYLNAKAAWLSRRRQVRHTILSPSIGAGDAGCGRMRLPGIAVPGIPGYRVPWSVCSAVRAIGPLAPDLIEAGDAGHAAWAALRIRRRLGIPAAAFYHSDLPQLAGQRFGPLAQAATRRYLRRLYGQFDLVLAPSRCMVEQLHAMGVHATVHQPLGIDGAIFNPWRRLEGMPGELAIPPGARLLVYAGRFTPEKKLHVLLAAMRKLGPPYHLLLIGGSMPLEAHPHVSHVPFVNDQKVLAQLLANCDVLVHPGDCETFGLIVLEAMACGLPVVATRGGAIAELVDDATGVLVAPNDVAALCAGIHAVYRRDRTAMSLAAARRARELYDWNNIMPQLMGRYAMLLASRGREELETERICATD